MAVSIFKLSCLSSARALSVTVTHVNCELFCFQEGASRAGPDAAGGQQEAAAPPGSAGLLV